MHASEYIPKTNTVGKGHSKTDALVTWGSLYNVPASSVEQQPRRAITSDTNLMSEVLSSTEDIDVCTQACNFSQDFLETAYM